IAQVEEYFPGASVSLDSARLRLLGGIALSELRLSRRDDPDKAEFANVPYAVIYHDKEQLLDGKLAIRKMKLQRPRLRLLRRADGSWNLVGLTGPVGTQQALPTIVVEQGTLVVEDHLASPGAVPLEIKDVELTLINDPPSTVTLRAKGNADLVGTVLI